MYIMLTYVNLCFGAYIQQLWLIALYRGCHPFDYGNRARTSEWHSDNVGYSDWSGLSEDSNAPVDQIVKKRILHDPVSFSADVWYDVKDGMPACLTCLDPACPCFTLLLTVNVFIFSFLLQADFSVSSCSNTIPVNVQQSTLLLALPGLHAICPIWKIYTSNALLNQLEGRNICITHQSFWLHAVEFLVHLVDSAFCCSTSGLTSCCLVTTQSRTKSPTLWRRNFRVYRILFLV